MSDITQIKTGAQAAEGSKAISNFVGRISIRASAKSYAAALFIISFFSLFLIYLTVYSTGIVTAALGWVLIPLFALTDRIVFDGKRIYRTGILPRLWMRVNNSRKRLKITDVEQIETFATRAIKRGGKILYRYRTSIRGKGMDFVLVSGGDDFRQMIRTILPRLSENVLDIRSIELRDYLSEPKETLMKAELERIPPADVLENSFGNAHSMPNAVDIEITNEKTEKAEYLRIMANELRLSGYLLQSLEVFRRAMRLNPRDGRLLLEFARCLQSFAGAQHDAKLERRSIAMMRLAERRATNDTDLLERLGESYFGAGEFRRAGAVFQKAVDSVGESFRSVKGLAELALREGKIAHVIHHFSTANRLAGVPALRRWSRGEAEYFSRLNSNDEYMDVEISRVNLLGTLENSEKTVLRIGAWGIPTIVIGILFEDSLIADIGWAVSSVSLLIWVGLVVGSRMLSRRIPFELLKEED